ncbi:DNA-directed RNA polymerase [Coemansia sp. RSA 1285]|nr:DNA-directed RNA polymerase [Coemansia sp. RSA 1285]
MRNVALVLMKEMQRHGYSFHNMLLSSHLTDNDIENVKNLARTIASEGSEDSGLAEKILQAVEEAEMELTNISSESADKSVDQDGSESNTAFVNGLDIAEDRSYDSSQTRAIPIERDTVLRNELKAAQLVSTNVSGVNQLKSTLKTLYENDLKGYNLQVKVERDSYDAALAQFREINKGRGDPLLSGNVAKIRAFSASWMPQLEALIEEEQERCRNAAEQRTGDRVRAHYGEFFRMLDAPKIAIITIMTSLRMLANTMMGKAGASDDHSSSNEVKVSAITSAISTAIHDEIKMERIKKRNNRHILGRNVSIAKLANSGKLFNHAVRRAKAKEIRETTVDISWIDNWSSDIKVRIGSLLISMLIEVARVPETFNDPDTHAVSKRMVPALKHERVFLKGRQRGIIVPHSVLRDMFAKESIMNIVTPHHLPMLVPPRPWLAYNSGGYLTKNEACMRTKGGNDQLKLLMKASREDRLCTIFSGLDALGQTRWAVNHAVFAAVIKVWNSGIELAEIPASKVDAPEPKKPDDYDTNAKAKIEHNYKINEWRSKRSNQHSLRCDCNYKVEIAKAFLNHPIYFPHNLDFRGRAYPIPPHFNHLGNDLCRGFLVFHEGRPLTKRGLFWLKIHLANVVGKDKLSHQERIEFVEAHEKDILASADNPVPDSVINQDSNAPRPWWLEAEYPWQTLAACVEYAAAIRSPNPEEYISHLHIHQDGTCNGLQHYAAMGRDNKGAWEVNLAPSDRPQDVYLGILNSVQQIIDDDCKKGVWQALALQNKLTRKIVKQTVMTNVYGVTIIGAKDQIAARLRELVDDNGEHVFQRTEIRSLAMYVAMRIFDSIGAIFVQAQHIQSWLNESARRIAKSMPTEALNEWKHRVIKDKESKQKFTAAKRKAKKDGDTMDIDTILEIRSDLGPGSRRRKRLDKLSTKPMATVTWTTPLGLTVTQPYRKYVSRVVNTHLQNISVYDTNMPSPVNSQKQKTAFPPNFVHSLDASHMIMSAIECKIAGMTFASVHDSYWTHACDIDRMNVILRDQFVKLHELPIMENLKAEFESRFADYKMPVESWEYVSISSSNADGKVAALSKKERVVDDDKILESRLAEYHLNVCEDSDEPPHQSDLKEADTGASASPEQGSSDAVPEPMGEHVKVIDLANINIIDPKQDLVGAIKQEDCIAYTLAVNANTRTAKRNEITREYKKKIFAVRKAAKAKTSSKRKASKTEPATDTTPEHTNTNKKDPAVLQLEAERRSKYEEIDAKYITTLARKPIMVPSSSLNAMRSHSIINDWKKSIGVSGKFIRRMVWMNIEFDPLPKQGDFDIGQVRNSPYFFS